MTTKKNYFFIIILLGIYEAANAQHFCDCDSINKNKSFSGYCVEYFDLRMFRVIKSMAQLKRYTLFQNGRKAEAYPFEAMLLRKERIIFNEKELKSSDTVMLFNGLYKLRDKKSRIYEEFYYKQGYLIKHVVKSKNIWYRKMRGKFVFEIAEYDYSTYPFKQHYIRYRSDGTIKVNHFIAYENGRWFSENADQLMSADPLGFKGVFVKN